MVRMRTHIQYVIQYWSLEHRSYITCYSHADREKASIMFHKPYYKKITRRLVKITTEIQLVAKGQK